SLAADPDPDGRARPAARPRRDRRAGPLPPPPAGRWRTGGALAVRARPAGSARLARLRLERGAEAGAGPADRAGRGRRGPRPAEFRLGKAGRVRVTFEGAADPKQLAGLRLQLSRQPTRPEDGTWLNATKEVTVGADGAAVIEGVCPGDCVLTPESVAGVPYLG